MTDEEEAAQKAADEQAAAEKEAAEKAEAEKNAKKTKKVRVICEGTLGPRLLVKDDVTADPDYVSILEQPGQMKVEAVK